MDKNRPFANIYYFRLINRIGGTEQFLYEMAKKYHGTDLVILYDSIDFDQLMRLNKLVRCIRRKPGQIYYANRAFYNFNLEALDQIKADEHIFVCHAIYQELGYKPPLGDNKITRFIGVSQYACDKLKEYAKDMGLDIEPELCYNPLSIEKVKPLVRLVSACRLDDRVKGGQRTQRLIETLDKYAEKNNRNYIWTIFTNSTSLGVESPNVAFMQPRVDVRPYIADADWLVQVSNDMESYCYSINEALSYGVGIVRTPLTVANELNIPKQAELVLDWDCKNVNEIAERIFKPRKKFSYKAPEDGWKGLLVPKTSNYTYSKQNVLVKPLTAYYDIELGRNISPWTPPFEVTIERARILTRKRLVRVVQ